LGGIPKGLERVGATRILDRVVGALGQATREIVLVANDPEASTWLPAIPVVSDRHPGLGGLAGVETALANARNALVVAWDMPFISGALLRALADAAVADDADAVVPASSSPHGFEPFCAFYSSRVRVPLSEFLRAGGGAAGGFLRGLPGLRILSAKEVSLFGDAERLFFSVNTPQDLERARAIAAAPK
jgi:molybdenum cofactor guanylyltransferase